MTPSARSRLRAAALIAAALLLLASPLIRPWHDESTREGAAAAMGSGAWVVSHLLAMLGLVLVGLGLPGVWAAVRETPAEPLAEAATVSTWLGITLVLPYYGAETFGLHVLAADPDHGAALLDVATGLRSEPVAITLFGSGLLAIAAGSVMTAVAVRRSGNLPPHAGVPFTLAFLLLLPQFVAPPPARIAHGVLVAIGCLWLARHLWPPAGSGSRGSAQHP